jgi:hypothetical protein
MQVTKARALLGGLLVLPPFIADARAVVVVVPTLATA